MVGLNNEEVNNSRKKYGNNKIEYKNVNSFFKLLIESLGDPIIKILLIALGIKVVFLIKDFDWYETVGIVIAIFIASFISSISEYGSEKAFLRLQEESSKLKCKVIRNKKLIEICIDDVVVGDLIKLSSGDRIPADGVLIKGNVVVDESSINGETKENYKKINSKLYRGTVVNSNEGYMKVEKVGILTEYGKIYKNLSEKNEDSPLKIRLRKLAKIISYIGYVGAFFVSIAFLFKMIVINNNFDLVLIKNTIHNYPLFLNYILYSFTLCVTIIVVSVPDGFFILL